MGKPSLTFITNIPSPYNLDLFESLTEWFQLEVYYYKVTEKERQWNLEIKSSKYRSSVFRTDFLHSFLQKINRNLYFNFHCLLLAFTKRSDFFILGGNYFAPNNIILLLVLRIRNQKIVWYGEKLLPTRSKFLVFLKKCLITPVNICTKSIFAVGNSARYSYYEYGYKKNIYNTPYAINPSRFQAISRKAIQPGGKIIFLSSGSLIHRKGYDLAIDAFNQLSSENKARVEYWIMGDGPLLLELKNLVHKDVAIKFIGFVEPDELNKYFAEADVFLLSSRYDGWGVVVNEAISAGMPVIVTNTCGASEYVDEKGGFVINCTCDEIRNKIETFLAKPELISMFSAFNVKKANIISSYSIAEAMVSHLHSI